MRQLEKTASENCNTAVNYWLWNFIASVIKMTDTSLIAENILTKSLEIPLYPWKNFSCCLSKSVSFLQNILPDILPKETCGLLNLELLLLEGCIDYAVRLAVHSDQHGKASEKVWEPLP